MHKRVLIIGEVYIDTHLDIIDVNGPLVRLGGIFHSARAFAAINVEYALAYYAPEYLDDDINNFACMLKTKGCYKLGNVHNAPNVMLINESKETGNQGYYNIIKDQANFIDTSNIQEIISLTNPTDIIIYPGRYQTRTLIRSLQGFNGRIHIDYHYDSEDLLEDLETRIATVSISTSSSVFKNNCQGNFDSLIRLFGPYAADFLLLKENRGGARGYSFSEGKEYESPSYYVPTMHSVGVGDVYNSIFIGELFENDLEKKMKIAALCAARYAETMYYDKFETNVQLVMENADEMITLDGVRLSWEERESKNVYLAAPDFPEVNVTLLEQIAGSLKYHNFTPRLPIRENGIVKTTMTSEQEIEIYQKDLALMNMCDLLIAVLLFNDPGTLVELGMFTQSGKPTIIFDPYNICDNMFVRHTPTFVCKTVADVMDSTYQCLRRR